jgi:hypothetical protein
MNDGARELVDLYVTTLPGRRIDYREHGLPNEPYTLTFTATQAPTMSRRSSAHPTGP